MTNENKAMAGMICSIASLVVAWMGWGAILGLILGIIGVVFSVNAKKAGINDGKVKAGLICGIIGIILSGIVFVTCIICGSLLAAATSSLSSADWQSIANAAAAY